MKQQLTLQKYKKSINSPTSKRLFSTPKAHLGLLSSDSASSKDNSQFSKEWYPFAQQDRSY
ncbi:hypothetical protein TTHERM_00143650 (macronuclear) [Tetrahymena thermophila SB210]|uniref:Uncharacterized protein n=1 Tax=Tetrahymena thermophila (strain SB210) TaxID=312017 RepID=I7MDS4_TETTS|nr:hypothetical protein TTHERM_00143650 [Tetrahymena thermophila SB210]EAR90859.1 hypothetical protein TTHERM_00143650 [Tetrahymena thermophila SB210]|eukprot:XP_001011104.1 hypothetical protein TTHERM_00143650 [Tetrahymena thermophila SB210]